MRNFFVCMVCNQEKDMTESAYQTSQLNDICSECQVQHEAEAVKSINNFMRSPPDFYKRLPSVLHLPRHAFHGEFFKYREEEKNNETT